MGGVVTGDRCNYAAIATPVIAAQVNLATVSCLGRRESALSTQSSYLWPPLSYWAPSSLTCSTWTPCRGIRIPSVCCRTATSLWWRSSVLRRRSVDPRISPCTEHETRGQGLPLEPRRHGGSRAVPRCNRRYPLWARAVTGCHYGTLNLATHRPDSGKAAWVSAKMIGCYERISFIPRGGSLLTFFAQALGRENGSIISSPLAGIADSVRASRMASAPISTRFLQVAPCPPANRWRAGKKIGQKRQPRQAATGCKDLRHGR
jgi:hypothetical protein